MYIREGNCSNPGERKRVQGLKRQRVCRRRGVDGYAELPNDEVIE